jgi:putative membrane protein
MLMHDFGGGWFPGMGIMMALVCVGVIVLIVWGITRLVRHKGCCASTTATTLTKQPPVDIAKERYAKGELTKEQFEQIKKDLS